MRTRDDVEAIQIEVCSASVYEFDYTPVDTYHRRVLHACVRLDTNMTVRRVFESADAYDPEPGMAVRWFF